MEIRTMMTDTMLKATKTVTPYVRGEDLTFRLAGSNFCCGMLEVGSFGWKDNAFYMYRKITESTGKELKEIFKTLAKQQAKSMLYASTANLHQPDIEKALELAGWEKTTSFQNGNTGNQITFWTFKS
jgi:hypothetical protein